MSTENRLWQIISTLAVLLTAAVPAYVAYDLYGRGPAPQKQLAVTRISPIDPMKDLSALGEKVSLSLKVEDRVLNNLVIARTFLKNTGGVPIVPTDYFESLSVAVQKPWKIVAVENSKDLTSFVELRWKRVNDTKFAADPALLNPGDVVSVNVYLTNTEYAGAGAKDKQLKPDIEWKVRITNLSALSESPSERSLTLFSIDVHLGDWSLAFTIIAALIFQALYLHLLSHAGLLRDWTWQSIALVLGASLLSFAAAESSATYLFGHPLGRMFGVNIGVTHWLNAPWILLHVGILALLYRRTLQRRRPAGGQQN